MSGWIDHSGWIHCPTCGNKILYYQSQTPRRRADDLQDKSCGWSAFTFDLWLGLANQKEGIVCSDKKIL